MKFARIVGTGSYLPSQVLTNYDLEKTIETTHDWIVSRSGISTRRIASADETTSYMATQAALKAIEAAGISPDEIDMVIAATCTPDAFFPTTACSVAHAINPKHHTPAFDVSAACSGFIYALDVAKQYIQAKTYQTILVVGSEKMSKALDWQDRGTCVLFGDGAGAVVVRASDEPGILESVLHAELDEDAYLRYHNATCEQSHSTISMKGNEVFKLAVNIMGGLVDEILQKAQLTKKDINWLVPHQANIRIIHAIAKKLDLSLDQVIITIENQGNTSAASIPLALDYSIREQRIKRGDTLLLEAFGGGMTWGAMILKY